MRSHTGAVMTLGKGVLLSLSAKQKINTKSSTEVKIVAVNDAMNFIEWVQLFVEDHIRDITPKSPVKLIGNKTTIQQDNTSAIQLRNNGKRSSTKQTRHINICYFYITDKVKGGHIKIVYHSTTENV